jgi:YfiH family protein
MANQTRPQRVFFSLDLSSRTATHSLLFAEFPFLHNGKPLAGDAPICAISLREAGDMGLRPRGVKAGAPDGSPNCRTSARLALYRALGVDAERVFACEQTHSRVVEAVDLEEYPSPGPSNILPADGLVGCGQAVLSVTVADCLPVYLFDRRSRAFSVCHSGWKGTGIALEALRVMRERHGTDAADVCAVLGPCIRGDDYEVDAERAHQYEAEFGGGMDDGDDYPLGPVTHAVTAVNNCVEAHSGAVSFYLDMQAANAHLLTKAGVRDIAVCTNSTLTCDALGSYRRQGAKNFTRMAALCFMKVYTTPPPRWNAAGMTRVSRKRTGG